MRKVPIALAFSIIGSTVVCAQEMAHPIAAADIKWMPAPPFMPAGWQVAVLAGDPGKEGSPFTVRLKGPADSIYPPHYIPNVETVTVLSGELVVGIGDKFEKEKTQRMTAGSFIELPGAPIYHYSQNVTDVIVEVHSTGPGPVIYANPADDPSKK